MKKMRKVLALVLAMAMVFAYGAMVFAGDDDAPAGGDQPAAEAAAPTSGSITVNSPVVGATYKVYKIFEMTTNAAVDSFSYTIDENSPFYGAVVAYASDAAKGLTLTRIAGSDPAKYNVSVDESKFNAQNFGTAMQAVLANGSPAVVADEAKGIVAKDAADAAITETASKDATVATSGQLKFDGLELGYFLVNPTYPAASYGTVTMGEQEFTTADLAKDEAGKVTDPLALTDDAKTKINNYVEATVTDAYVEKYISDNGITTNKDGTPLNDAGKAEYKADLINTMKTDAEAKVLAAFANKLDGSEADINVKQPILVFLDSSQPNAVINEKNELDKWDVPVNPDGETKPGTPDHGNPDGGKNIVVQEDPAYYADWSEAEIGESVHYQLRVNAMNFIRTGSDDTTVEQVKEYFLADYQSGHMHFDESKGLHVSVWAGNDANNSQAGMTNVTKNPDGSANGNFLDYTSKASTFFKNTTNKDAESKPDDIFGEGTGIMVPWVKVSEANPTAPDPNFPIYTTTKVPTGEYLKAAEGETQDGDGYALDENNNRIPLYDTYYVYSLYNSDVTIVVDYWMILDDNAIVDEPGNKNYAQYGWSPVDNKDGDGNPKKPGTPGDGDKPSKKEEVDEATVYTFALAWVKVDNKGNELAGATFQLPFYVKTAKDNDGAYVYGGKEAGNGLTNTVTTTKESAVITIKGVEQGKYSITETVAPEGYNKLAAPFEVEAKKSGNGVTTKTSTTTYLDEKGNVTSTETSTTKEYVTDKDSNVTNVPVYQFDPVVNKKGQELPSTGGMGTTLFYLIGAILVIGAGVVLVTRRRVSVQ